jgi:hypothetical protein
MTLSIGISSLAGAALAVGGVCGLLGKPVFAWVAVLVAGFALIFLH